MFGGMSWLLPESSPADQELSDCEYQSWRLIFLKMKASFAKISLTISLSGRSAARSQTSTLTVDF